MKTILAITTAAATLFLCATAVQAQVMIEGDYYVIETSSGNKLVVGRTAGGQRDSRAVLTSVNGNAPATCANGDFWESSSGVLLACAGGAQYDLIAPDAGAAMSDGESYPAGAMRMRRR